MRKRGVMAALMAAGAMAGVWHVPARAESRPVVAELFTSEGCSSCPPADALLSELARARPDVLPLAFHITYWDRLGWPDPFALRVATERQRGYAATLGLDNVYTPQLVVDGIEDVVGSDRGAVYAALRTAATAAAVPVALRLARAGTTITLEIGGAVGPAREAAVVLIGYDPAHSTPIARGENAGRTLTEANIVRAILPVGDWHGSRLKLSATAPAGERLAALLQAKDGHVLGAARLE